MRASAFRMLTNSLALMEFKLRHKCLNPDELACEESASSVSFPVKGTLEWAVFVQPRLHLPPQNLRTRHVLVFLCLWSHEGDILLSLCRGQASPQEKNTECWVPTLKGWCFFFLLARFY